LQQLYKNRCQAIDTSSNHKKSSIAGTLFFTRMIIRRKVFSNRFVKPMGFNIRTTPKWFHSKIFIIQCCTMLEFGSISVVFDKNKNV
jgi:hypothetical protein